MVRHCPAHLRPRSADTPRPHDAPARRRPAHLRPRTRGAFRRDGALAAGAAVGAVMLLAFGVRAGSRGGEGQLPVDSTRPPSAPGGDGTLARPSGMPAPLTGPARLRPASPRGEGTASRSPWRSAAPASPSSPNPHPQPHIDPAVEANCGPFSGEFEGAELAEPPHQAATRRACSPAVTSSQPAEGRPETRPNGGSAATE